MARRTAAEVIAFYLGWDYAEMSDCRYQPTRFANPAIYTCDNDYYAAPASGRMPRNYAELKWEVVGEAYGRPIFRGHSA